MVVFQQEKRWTFLVRTRNGLCQSLFSARNQHAETLKSREQSMLNEYGCERIRRAYDLEKKSIYQIANEEGCCHQAIEKAHFGPLHYLPSLEHRQGTFDYVKPFKHWREELLACYR